MRTEYRRLNQSRITEHLNNANLCIRALHCEEEAIHPGDLTNDAADAINAAAKDTVGFIRRMIFALLPDSNITRNNVQETSGVYAEYALEIDVGRHSHERGQGIGEVRKLLLEMTMQLNSSFKLVALYPNREYTYYLHRWDSILVSIASRLELLLGNFSAILSRNRGGDSSVAEDFEGLSISESVQ